MQTLKSKIVLICLSIVIVVSLTHSSYGASNLEKIDKELVRYKNNAIGYTIDFSENIVVREEENTRLNRLVLSGDKKSSLAIYVKDNKSNLTLEEWGKSKFDGTLMKLIGEININRVKGLKYEGKLHGDSTFVFLSYKDKVLEIEYFTPYGKHNDYKQEFISVINSLKLNSQFSNLISDVLFPVAHAAVDGFDFPLGKPNGIGYAPNGLEFLEQYDYQNDTFPEYHPGEDWNDDNSGSDWGNDSNDAGDPVYAAADGVIKYADYYSSGWGRIVYIEHTFSDGSKKWSQYAHIASISSNPRTGQQWAIDDTVYRGEQIGTVGDYPSGSGSAYHLHFEIRKINQSPQAFPYNTSWDSQINDYQPWPRSKMLDYYTDPSDFINANRPPTYISGSISQNTTWYQNRVYVIQGQVTVNSGVTLTIEPGVVVKFQDTSSSLVVNGTLNASGTSTDKVYFTSLKDDSVGGDTNGDGSATTPAAGNWKNMQFSSGSTGNLDNAIVRYGGSSTYPVYNEGGTLAISNSEINSNSFGVYQFSGSLNLTGSKVYNNGSFGFIQDGGSSTFTSNEIYNQSSAGIAVFGGTATVSQNNIHDNSSYGIYNSATNVINAENNYWGAASGPYHPTLNSSGTGNAVSNNVDFEPWLINWP